MSESVKAAEPIEDGRPQAYVDPEVLDKEQRDWTPKKIALWVAISLLGAVSWWMIAIVRGETVNGIWFVFAAVCSYLIGYRFYSRFIEAKLAEPDDRRATPAEYDADGKDYAATDRRVLYGHHFAAIAGAGPLVGPVLAAQMGFLPGTIWIIVGVIFAGAVQDYLVLFFSMRRGGRSLGQMAKEELGTIGGYAAILATLAIMIIITAILALVVVNALGESPWGVFSVGMTIPIALFMGVYLRYLRPGKVGEVSIIGFILLMLAIISGGWVAETSWGIEHLTLDRVTLAWAVIIYGFVAAILPVWLLLAPRDYLSTFMKVGTIVLLAVGIVVVRPEISVPAFSEFASRSDGPVWSGSLFPFLFVTIACGALSGFHALIASGTTPKMVEKERQTRFIGYGGMLMESFVAIMALVAAITVDRGIYFAMNSGAGATGGTVEGAVAFVNSLGLAGVNVTPELLTETATNVGEHSIVSRTGGAPTLAVGMAGIMHDMMPAFDLMSFWYHFAIMFEALFILTAVDAGTRVARFMLSDTLGNFYPRFRDHNWRLGAWITTAVMVAGWGGILILGVTDPLGGINTFYPLFGIANQLLAAVALAVCLAIAANKRKFKYLWIIAVPLVFDLVVTVVGSWQKIFSSNPKVGYWANHNAYKTALESGAESFGAARSVAEIEAVVRNTFVQGSLSIVFVVLTLVVVAMALVEVIRAWQGHEKQSHENPYIESKLYAPSGMTGTRAERALEAEWKEFYKKHPEEIIGSAGHSGH
ncbi:carbon starvation protein, predicted membrane protein [Corynebacterium kutscheri]|uniref:Carbon starvation protein, predicted membrane protein n=1 Tax=Corynebacterium kutscheri TaxID=35755 RepID=A0A0F6R1B4_9CORY|nr:carbon starvation CstA family protein [Corynebacterium kutscheri]AKE40908.1 carbon starvation protein, predicted membrane protein [Corynebacterium kutscheri]VEH09207.1 carbon starvation protein [Corynebacterium kutscheri]